MQAKMGLPEGTYDLKIGKSFSKSTKNRPDYHTLRYDFKPKSVSAGQETYIGVGSNDDVHIAFANDASDNLTMYKGASKPLKDGKECLLIFDEDRGEMRLEKVISNLNVKQIRGADPEMEQTLRGQIEKIRSRNPQRNNKRHRSPTPEKEKPKRRDKSPVKPQKQDVKVNVASMSLPATNNKPPIAEDDLFAQMSTSSSSSSSDEGEEGEILDDTQETDVTLKNHDKNVEKGSLARAGKKFSFDIDSPSTASSSSSSEDEFAAELERRLNASPSPEPMATTTNDDEDMPDIQRTSSSDKLLNDLDLSDSSDED